MWPWRRRVEVVLASSAGDDATAALTMILRYHRKPVTLDEVRQAIHKDRKPLDVEAAIRMLSQDRSVTLEEVLRATRKDRVPHAGTVVEAADRFDLHARGLAVDDPMVLKSIPTPNIAHMMRVRGQYPRPLEGGLDGYFAVVVSISQHNVHWINPYVGQLDDEPDAFCEFASGIFLVFDEAAPLPRARLRPVASDG